MLKIWLVLLIGSIFSAGKSTEGLRLPEDINLEEYRYEPVDLVYWAKVKKLLENKNYVELVYFGLENQEVFDPATPEYAEGRLALAMALYNLDFSFASTKIFMDLAKNRIGTQIGYMALHYLDEISQKHYVDRLALWENFLNSYEFGELPDKIQSFVSFHQAIYNSAYGYEKWAEPQYKKIHPKSYWYNEWIYLSAIANINQEAPEEALKLFRALAESEDTPRKISDNAKKQIARLIFEEGQFEKSLELYNELNLNLREKGRVLLERAWAMYYEKKYSEALGMLRALEAPYFMASLNPEIFILQMIIYKQLCHYESVIDSVDKFYREFEPAIKDIENREALEKNPKIARMALMQYDIQPEANFVNLIETEYEKLKSYNWDGYDFYKVAVNQYESKIAEVKLRLEPKIERKSKEIARELLDFQEQIDFLDYSAKLDALRIIRKGENRNYTSEKIDYLQFDKIFWLFRGEYWLDELPDYRMLISSRCSDDNESFFGPSQETEDGLSEEADF